MDGTTDRAQRAAALKRFASIDEAVTAGALSQFQEVSLAEALVLGLWNVGVRTFVGIFGHGNTAIGEVLRTYEAHGLVRTFNVRHETAASHAATALRWIADEQAAVITSIGPGALHALAGALVPASNGLGVWYIVGDETTHDEGFNMQQIPRNEQGGFLKLFSAMGDTYALYEPSAIFAALRRGAVVTGRRAGAGPFFMTAPMNMQEAVIRRCNLLEFPGPFREAPTLCADPAPFEEATLAARNARRITIKYGRGALGCGAQIVELSELLDAAVIGGPSAAGVVPYAHPRFMTVGGSKGSIAGNYAMNKADLVVVIGARAVCQWDSSGTAFREAQRIINFNLDPHHAAHYNRTVTIVGDARTNLNRWIAVLRADGFAPRESDWTRAVAAKRAEWSVLLRERTSVEPLPDPTWGTTVLTQPTAVEAVRAFADAHGAVKVFDAGDVQANGFQITRDEREGLTLNDTGASYMGFAVSAILASAITRPNPDTSRPYLVAFTGDGSFMMNPQILIDAVEHGARGCIALFDNRSMAAIHALQRAQYGHEYKTRDTVAVDYVKLAAAVSGVRALWGGTTREELDAALKEAFAWDGLSLVHIPVYSGSDPRGEIGAFGDWNVGNWCERVQAEHHRIGL